jgi:eukaryotic-like serine/threonine-protein kinase
LTSGDKSLEIYESLNTDLSEIYQMAVKRDDLLSEDFSSMLYTEIRDLKKRYGNELLLSQGGMKKVYKVEDKTTGRFVAMAYSIKGDEQHNERFLREARLTSTLEHPNIMPVYDIGINEAGEPFFSMKLTGDQNLYEILKERMESGHEWPLVQRLNLFLSICEGLSYAHSRHVLHLDIKPQNILVGEFGEVLICDWGLGKILFDQEDEDDAIDPSFFNEMTMDGVIKGTPGYMAPEQVDKKLGDRDQRTDIYALGGILYALLSGQTPVKGETVDDIFGKTISGEIKPLRAYDSRVPLALEAVAMKSLATLPDERYHSVEDVKTDIESFLGGFSTKAEKASFLRNAFLLMKRHKATTFFLLLIVLLSATFIWQLQKSEKQARQLLALYQAEKKQTELLGRDASPHFATQALRHLYTYEFELSRDFADKAVLRDNENTEAWDVKALVHFYSQEFNAAIDAFRHAPQNSTNEHFLALALRYSDQKKDDERLGVAAFKDLVSRIPTLMQKRTFFRNEVANYRNVKAHMEFVKVMLLVNNPFLKKVNFKFTQKGGKNQLDLSGNSLLEQVGCIREMPLHKLNVEGLNLVDHETAQFRGMPLEDLNVAGTQISDFNFLATIPNLKRLTLSKGSCSKELIESLRARMEVIEK